MAISHSEDAPNVGPSFIDPTVVSQARGALYVAEAKSLESCPERFKVLEEAMHQLNNRDSMTDGSILEEFLNYKRTLRAIDVFLFFLV